MFPNRASSQFQLVLDDRLNQKALISVYDVYGAFVLQCKRFKFIHIIWKKFDSGVYHCR